MNWWKALKEALRKYWENLGATYKYDIPSIENRIDDILPATT